MKISILLVVVFLARSTPIVANDPCKQIVEVLSTKMDIFYFKLCKVYTGGLVQVYSQEGDLLASHQLEGNKAVVDFYFEKAGTYVIKINVEGKEEKFDYVKLAPPPLTVADLDYHVVITEQ